jgi:hypothetical protein
VLEHDQKGLKCVTICCILIRKCNCADWVSSFICCLCLLLKHKGMSFLEMIQCMFWVPASVQASLNICLSVVPDWVWGPPSHLFSEYCGFSRCCGMMLTSNFNLMARLRMSLAIPLFPYLSSWGGKGWLCVCFQIPLPIIAFAGP